MSAAPKQIDLPPLDIRADVRPGSVDAEARTAEVVFSTGSSVMRSDWFGGTRYVETLSMKPKDVRLDRLNSGAPFLNTHSSESLGDILGVVVADSARVVSGKALATIRFSKRADVEPVWQDIRDGIIRNVSVGYRVHKYEVTEASEGKPEIRHAVDWEPYEISAVPMPADAGAQVRADRPDSTAHCNPCALVRAAEETAMPDEPSVATGSTLLTPPPPVIIPAAATDDPEPMSERALGTEEERQRIQGILDGCLAARLTMSFAQDLIKRGVPLVDARGIILNALRGVETGPSKIPSGVGVGVDRGPGRVTVDVLDTVWRGIQDAMLAKIAPKYFKLGEIGYPYQARSCLSFVELCLHHRGISTTNMTKDELASAGLGYGTRGSGFHTTSDFANVLIDAINKVLRAAYAQAPQTFEPITRRMNLSDFKTMNVVQFGEAPALLEVKENGEFTSGTMTDAKETIRLKTYGRKFPITRQALINDDMNAFGDVPIAFAKSARQKESDLVWEQITSNPTMGDGNALFVAAHGNLDSSGNAIDDTVIGEGFAAMRIQKGLDGTTPLNIAPRYLVVPVAKESLALKYTAVISPALGANVMPYATRLSVITEPRLDANSTTAWYLMAGADDVPIIGLAFLDGQDGPAIETRTGWEIDGIEIRCRHDVAAKVLDWRGVFKNVGA